jgi:hypothetical protein
MSGQRRVKPPIPKLIDPLATMPATESERMADAVRRVLPELLRIYRYEQRAAARRDTAIRKMSKHSMKLSRCQTA